MVNLSQQRKIYERKIRDSANLHSASREEGYGRLERDLMEDAAGGIPTAGQMRAYMEAKKRR